MVKITVMLFAILQVRVEMDIKAPISGTDRADSANIEACKSVFSTAIIYFLRNSFSKHAESNYCSTHNDRSFQRTKGLDLRQIYRVW